MLFQFCFACATNPSGTKHGLELCSAHWCTDRHFLSFAGSEEGVTVISDDVVC